MEVKSGGNHGVYEFLFRNMEVPEGLGVNIHFTDPRPGEMAMLAASGVRWVRMDILWPRIEIKKGQYDFSAYDRLMDALDAHGIRALLIFDDINDLYDDGYFPRSDEARAAFVRWAVASVTRYRGRGVLWEMWNEPNVADGRHKPREKEDYIRLALEVGEALRQAAPEEAYIGPATSLIDQPFLEACFEAGLLNYWWAVTVHPYRFKNPETVIPDYEELRALIARYTPPGRTVPVIQGEWGWASSGYNQNVLWFREEMNDVIQGRLLARQWLVNLACGIPMSIWYDWHDDGADPQNPEHNCGMVRHPYHEGRDPVYDPKDTYLAARTLTHTLQGFRFSHTVVTENPDDQIRVFRKGNQVCVAAWTTGRVPRTAPIPVEGACDVISHTGEHLPPPPVLRGEAQLALTEAPRYLLYTRA